MSGTMNTPDPRQLVLDEAEIRRLASSCETPLYLYCRRELVSQCERLRRAVGDDVRVCYSLKANPNPHLCREIRMTGIGAEVSSGGELCTALRTGFRARDIVASGPGKTHAEIDYLVREGVGVIHCESSGEIRRIEAAARSARRRVNVALRLNPLHAGRGTKAKMGGKSTQFGVDEESADAAIRDALRNRHARPVGFHVYCGTQILQADSIVSNCRYIAELAGKLVRRHGLDCRYLNLGGGLGIPFSADEAPLDLSRFGEGLAEVCAALRREPEFERTEIVIESGRFIVGSCGLFVCRIQDVKTSRGRRYVVTDGGINNYMAASPLLRWDRTNPMVSLIPVGRPRGPDVLVDVVGPLCTTIDICARQCPLPSPRVGDLVVFANAGAYGLTMSPVMFLGRPTPAEILVHDTAETVIRERGTFDSLLGDVPFTTQAEPFDETENPEAAL